MKQTNRRLIGAGLFLALLLTVTGIFVFPQRAFATNPGVDTASYPWEALFADESGQVEIHYFTGETTFLEKYLVPASDGSVELLTGETITENYTLSYWLHVPADYDPAKTYPILSIFPGVGSLYLSQNIMFGSTIDQGEFLQQKYTYALRRFGYTQGTLYLTSDWNAISAINANTRDENGNAKEGYPGSGAVWNGFGEIYDTHFLRNWQYDAAANPDYDCFILFIQPEGALLFDDDGGYPVVLYETETGRHASNYKYETEGAGDQPVAWGEALSTANSAKIGAGWWVDDTMYGSTYFASLLGPSPMEQTFDQLLDQMEAEYSIDTGREYLMGDSVGGLFVFDILSHYPDRFAAAVTAAAIGADISYANVSRLGNVHLLAFHDSFDPGYSINFSRLFVEKINAVRKAEDTGSARFVELETNHGGVTSVAYSGDYYEMALHNLFDHRLEKQEEADPLPEGEKTSLWRLHFSEAAPLP